MQVGSFSRLKPGLQVGIDSGGAQHPPVIPGKLPAGIPGIRAALLQGDVAAGTAAVPRPHTR